MLRLPAVAGRFYPSDPKELSLQVRRFTASKPGAIKKTVTACLVPHAGYIYSGHVAGEVYGKIAIPGKIIVLGVRHSSRGHPAAILREGSWRTPLGDAPIDVELATKIQDACPLLHDNAEAHRSEHSLEVQLPFLQTLNPAFSFVPVALGTIHFDSLARIGEGLGRVLGGSPGQVLLLTTSDLNHYEDDESTRRKDRLAIDQLLALDARGLFDVCAMEEISMCGLGPAVAMLTALQTLGAKNAEVVRHATSADVSGDTNAVVGYVGMTFR